MKKSEFEMFFTNDGIVSLNSPIKIKIMKILNKSKTSFEELVKKLKRAKSTISVHLEDLEKMKLISSEFHPNDKRKKIYSISSKYVGKSDIPLPELSSTIKKCIKKSINDPLNFSKLIFKAMRYELEAIGINTQPILKIIGRKIGNEIGETFKGKNIEELIKELILFWKNHKLGKMKVISKNPFLIEVRNCYNCSNMPNIGRTYCSFDEGLIEGIISKRLGINLSVKEIECWGTGSNKCKFKLFSI